MAAPQIIDQIIILEWTIVKKVLMKINLARVSQWSWLDCPKKLIFQLHFNYERRKEKIVALNN